jgi:UDPglucose 6-dehydrogenase
MAEGVKVVGYDPVAMENMQALLPTFCCTPSALVAVQDADACVLVTEWQEFLDLDWAAVRDTMAHPLIIDGRNALDRTALVNLGFTYEGVGRRL